MIPVWMPPLITLPQYNGDWDAYLAAVYAAFSTDFLGTRPPFQDKRMGLKRHPVSRGKEATFWHFVQSGPIEAEREPEMRRLERIRWPRAIIDHASDPSIKQWTEKRGKAERVHLWCEGAMYLVVLDDHDDYILPWTAYPITRMHEAHKLNRRWEENRP